MEPCGFVYAPDAFRSKTQKRKNNIKYKKEKKFTKLNPNFDKYIICGTSVGRNQTNDSPVDIHQLCRSPREKLKTDKLKASIGNPTLPNRKFNNKCHNLRHINMKIRDESGQHLQSGWPGGRVRKDVKLSLSNGSELGGRRIKASTPYPSMPGSFVYKNRNFKQLVKSVRNRNKGRSPFPRHKKTLSKLIENLESKGRDCISKLSNLLHGNLILSRRSLGIRICGSICLIHRPNFSLTKRIVSSLAFTASSIENRSLLRLIRILQNSQDHYRPGRSRPVQRV